MNNEEECKQSLYSNMDTLYDARYQMEETSIHFETAGLWRIYQTDKEITKHVLNL